MIIDSQAVKNTFTAGVEKSKGFCFYKCTNGIKRHLAVDSLGFPFFTHCTRASISDDAGLVEMLTININYFRERPEDMERLTILLDNGYNPSVIENKLKEVYAEIMEKIKFEVCLKITKAEKKAWGKSGFVVIAGRWVVERSNSWVDMCKCLVKNFESNLKNATAKINLCFIRLMIKRLSYKDVK